MSGWIKVEKDLESDPRVLRMAKALEKGLKLTRTGASLDPCNACALPGVTLVVGALARLWIYADSHARDDDTVDLSTAELDEWIGIADFCSLMPADWLIVIDSHTIELPNFHEHNNVEAKKRALTQKRVEKHRQKSKRSIVTPRNAPALPDQDQDQDHTKTLKSEERTRANGHESSAGNLGTAGPQSGDLDPSWRLTERLKAIYPPGTYRAANWLLAERELRRLLEAGEVADRLVELTSAFRAQQDAKSSTGTQFVLSPEKFFGTDGHWRGPFVIPKTQSEAQRDSMRDEFMRRTASEAAS